MPIARILTIPLMLTGLILAGCSQTSFLDENMGRSVQTAAYNQTIDPYAGQTTDPIEGMDGQSAVDAYEGYRSGFKGQKASPGAQMGGTGMTY